MVLFFWITLASICFMAYFSVSQSNFSISNVSNVLFEKEGNMSIMGIFNYRFDNKCESGTEKVLEEIASAIWTVETLNKYNYLPGVTIGLSIFGVCENLTNQKNLLQMVENSKFYKDNTNFIGALTTPEFHEILSTSESFSNKNFVHLEHIISIEMLIDAVIQLLINLHWMRVKMIASDSSKILKLFKEKASEEGILTEDELLMNGRCPCLKPSDSEKPLTIVMAAFHNIANLEKVRDESIRLILTPTNFVFDVTLLDLPKNAIVLLPAMENKLMLSNYIKNMLHHKNIYSHKPPTRGPLFIGTAASVLKLLKPTKKLLEKHCKNEDFNAKQQCASTIDSVIEILGNKSNLLSQKSMKIMPDDVEETLKVLRIEPNSNDEMFLCISFILNGNETDDFAIFQMFSLKSKKFQPVLIMVNDNLLRNRGISTGSEYLDPSFKFIETQKFFQSRNPIINFLGHSRVSGELSENFTFSSKISLGKNCDSEGVRGKMCPNSTINYTRATRTNETTENNPEVSWRFLTWVFINTSLGFVGVTCTLSTMFFVIIRLCKNDILEGSPYFTLLLMITVIFMYFSSLPFSMEFSSDNGFICGYRKNGPSVVFAVFFSLLLSRSLVLAFNESAKELNGYVQSVLCFFMIGVQISIILQKYFFEKENYDLNCLNIYHNYRMIFSLGYDFLLIFLLVCVSPFIVRLRQNHKEGLLLSISVFFITIIWSTWVSFYILLPNEHKDAAIAIGLNSTASVLLFCIFIPQTYFMADQFVRNGTLRSFSNLDRHILMNSSNFNFKSNQALHESGFGTISYKNCETGVSNPNFLKIHSNEDSNPVGPNNFGREAAVIDTSPEDSTN